MAGVQVGRAAAHMLSSNRGLETLDLRNNRLGKQVLSAGLAPGMAADATVRARLQCPAGLQTYLASFVPVHRDPSLVVADSRVGMGGC